MESSLRFLILMVCIFLWEAAAYGFEARTLFQSEELTITGEEDLEPESTYLGRIYPEARGEIEQTLGLRLTMRPGVLLIGNEDFFRKLSGSPFVSAFAVPSERLIVIHVSPRASKPAILYDIFKHELCHLLLHENIRRENLPRWLDEGICQWISGTLGEVLAGDAVAISRVEMAQRLIPLRQLAATFPKDKDLLLLAYNQSRDFVGFVADRYGAESLRDILNHLREGDDIGNAFSKALHKPLEDVQEEWIEDLKNRKEWLIWASRHMYEILFFGAAVLTILAAFRVKSRRARYLDEDEDEEDDPDFRH